MNKNLFNHAMQAVKLLTNDDVRMSFKTLGVDYVRDVKVSRNKREGFYAGYTRWPGGHHYRRKFFVRIATMTKCGNIVVKRYK